MNSRSAAIRATFTVPVLFTHQGLGSRIMTSHLFDGMPIETEPQ
jgi:hypothetical protein